APPPPTPCEFADRNPFSVEERPNLLGILLIAGAEHKQPIAICHLRDVRILFHDRVGKFARRRRRRRLCNRESLRRGGRVLGLLLHLVPAVGSTVVLLVIVKSE